MLKMKRKGKAGGMIVTILFISLFFLGFWYVSDTASNSSFGINTTLNNTTTIEQDRNWLTAENSKDNGTYLVEDGDDLYIESGENDTWVSVDYDMSNYTYGTTFQFEYFADPSSGTIDATIRSYNSTDDLIRTSQVALTEDYEEVEFTKEYQDTEYIDVKLDFNETANNQNKNPRIKQYHLTVFIDDYSEKVGLNEDNFYLMTMIVFLLTGLLFVVRRFG